MNILVENTTYSLLLYLLIVEEIQWKNTIYVFGYQIPNVIIKKISERLVLNSLYVQCCPKSNILLRLKNYYLYYIKVIFIKSSNKVIYGDDNFIFMSPFRLKKIILIEDGLSNYKLKKQSMSTLKKIKNFILLSPLNYNAFGLSDNVKKIYLTGLAPIPKEIAHKVEIINLKELWNKKSLEEQNEILDIFSFDLNIKETIKGRDIILFTQPLSEDGVITEDEKVEIYSKIVKKYPQNRLIVKTHPREKTNYKEIFKDNLVLDNPFPFEILNLLNVKFNKAVTIFSTAALGLGKDVAVDFYGTEVNDKMLARFGSCDNIMKRNSYLEEE